MWGASLLGLSLSSVVGVFVFSRCFRESQLLSIAVVVDLGLRGVTVSVRRVPAVPRVFSLTGCSVLLSGSSVFSFVSRVLLFRLLILTPAS